MKKLFLGTNNKHKIQEISALINPLGFEIITPNDVSNASKTVEDQRTLEGNALKKAREAFQATGMLSLADDTGLEVYYLGLEPGVFSARYSGENASYADNNKKLLHALNGVPERKRNARFRTVIAIIGKDIEKTVEGSVEGTILESFRGEQGFGYDPLFVPKGYSMTYAEMTIAEKNKLSHRAFALQKAIEFLRTIS